jgi:hypothetical protein
MSRNRIEDLKRFYQILAKIEARFNGTRCLNQCDGSLRWPARGVYFFFEPGEMRTDSGNGGRVVRVGTHALKNRSTTSMWNRLSQHKGNSDCGGGNHRGSVFRLLIGDALIGSKRERFCPTWGKGSSATREVRAQERWLEASVCAYICAMPFLWVAVLDDPGPASLRGFVERNAIALLSNFERPCLDPPSVDWLGLFCSRQRVRQSGLWNNNHVDEQYEPSFLDTMEELAERDR